MAKFERYEQGTPNWVELTSPDPQAAADFYKEVFGWDYQETPLDDEGSVYRTALVEGDPVAGLSGQMPELAGHPAFWGVFLATDDVDVAAAKVEGAGGKVEAGPFDVMELGRMAALVDPTGARVNLWQAKDHIGTMRANEPGTPIWNELTTPEIDTAVAFYGEVLGMGAEKMQMPDGEYTCLTNAAGAQIGGAMTPMMEGLPPHWNVYFNVEDVDATVAKVEAAGGKVVAPAFDVGGVGRMAVLADPHGGIFSLMTAGSPG